VMLELDHVGAIYSGLLTKVRGKYPYVNFSQASKNHKVKSLQLYINVCIYVCHYLRQGEVVGVLRLYHDALGHSHSASGHTDCKFLFAISGQKCKILERPQHT